MHPAKGGFLRRTEHWLVDMVMAALALVLERLVARSTRRGAKKGAGRARR